MFDTILSANGLAAYLLILICLMAGAFGLPIPEDLSLITAGILINFGHVKVTVMAVVCYIGVVLGDLVIYRIGYMAGPKLFRRPWFRKHVSTQRLQLIRSNLEKRAFISILIARHLFYLRTVTFLTCGAVRMRFVLFLCADLIAGLITVPLMLSLGYLFGSNYALLFHYVNKVKYALLLVGLILLLVWVYYIKRKSCEEEPTKDLEDKSPDH